MIIGLSGFKGSGKDTVASYLKNYGFETISYSGPLKDITAILFNWPRNLLEGNTKESREWREEPDLFWSEKLNIENFNPRYALQYIGTELLRNNFYHDIWITLIEKKINDKSSNNIVITDCRFKNELKLIEKMNGFLVHVKGVIPSWYQLAIQANNGDAYSEEKLKKLNIHKSEREWVGYSFDWVLNNDTTFKNLYNDIDKMLLQIERRLSDRS